MCWHSGAFSTLGSGKGTVGGHILSIYLLSSRPCVKCWTCYQIPVMTIALCHQGRFSPCLQIQKLVMWPVWCLREVHCLWALGFLDCPLHGDRHSSLFTCGDPKPFAPPWCMSCTWSRRGWKTLLWKAAQDVMPVVLLWMNHFWRAEWILCSYMNLYPLTWS